LSYADTHIHLEQYDEKQREKHITRAKAVGIKHIVAVSMDLASSRATHALALQYGQLIMPAYGFHPEQLMLSTEEEQQLMEWIGARAACGERFAIGEVGLPYYRGLELLERGQQLDKQPYIELLERFIVLAKELDRPIVLHAVYEDAAIACDLLQKHEMKRAHFHWFKGDEATIERMIECGYYISITPDVCYEQEIQALVKRYPLELLMVETDGPWPFEGEFQGKETESTMVVRVVEAIAALIGKNSDEVATQLYDNSSRFYRFV